MVYIDISRVSPGAGMLSFTIDPKRTVADFQKFLFQYLRVDPKAHSLVKDSDEALEDDKAIEDIGEGVLKFSVIPKSSEEKDEE